MSVFNGLLRAFGFGGGHDDEDNLEVGFDADEESATENDCRKQSYQSGDAVSEKDNGEKDAIAVPEAPDDISSKSTAGQDEKADKRAAAIFEGVVSVLNDNLPPYLRECLDQEEQCKFIYDRLDQDLRSYISSVAKGEAEKANRRWGTEKKKLFKQVNEATEQIAHATERASKAEEKALSADRQKRAMTQRNADLEKRVARLEAEIEQYDLEKSSLLNKLRVAEVMGGHNGSANLTADEKTIESDQLKKDLESARAEILSLTSRLEEANKALEVVGEIQQQLRGIENTKKRKNARIRELKDENAILRSALEAFQDQPKSDETDSRQHEDEYVATVEDDEAPEADSTPEIIDMTEEAERSCEPDGTGVSAAIADDMDLLAAISENEERESAHELQPQGIVKKKRKPRTRKPKLVAIDETISESEWLLSSTPVSPDVNHPSGFGYQEPSRRTTPPDNPAQMSLW